MTEKLRAKVLSPISSLGYFSSSLVPVLCSNKSRQATGMDQLELDPTSLTLSFGRE